MSRYPDTADIAANTTSRVIALHRTGRAEESVPIARAKRVQLASTGITAI